MNIDAPGPLTPVTINAGNEHYAGRIVDQQRNGRTLLVFPEWVIAQAYLPHDHDLDAIHAMLDSIRGAEARIGAGAWHPYVQCALRNSGWSPQVYTLRKDGTYREQGSVGSAALTIH